jgi:hypothetical protein
MRSVMDALNALAALVGQNWLIAAALAFVVMVFESAKPPPVEGEPEPRASILQRVAMIASLLTPFLLFLGAFGAFTLSRMGRGEGSPEDQNEGLLLAFGGAAIAFVLVPGILGWITAKALPPLANLLRGVAPFLALAVFAFTVYVTYRNAFFVLNLYVLSHMR